MASREASRSKPRTDAPAPVLKLGGPTPPKIGNSSQASWFQPLKARKLTSPPPTFTGSGVPENDNVKKAARHGYWKRQRRYKPGKGKRTPVTDAYYFYYTGTGPFADLKWGQQNDDVIWVADKDADPNVKSGQGTRDPDKFDQFPLRFSDGGPDDNYRWDFIPVNSRGRSGRSSAATSREQSRAGSRENSRGRRQLGPNEDLIARAAKIIEEQQKRGSRITKAKANEMAERRYCKRTLAPGKNVDQVFGARQRGKDRNFGDDKMVEEGIRDGRTTAMLNLVPSSHALLFGSHVQAKLQPDGLHVSFSFTTVVPRDDPQFENYRKICDECIDGVGTRPKEEAKPRSRSVFRPNSRAVSPAPKPQRQKKDKKQKSKDSDVADGMTQEEKAVNDQLEFDDADQGIPDKIDWGSSALGDSEI
uniref:Nucleoprotein n=1 Tax=Pigeon coronavirus TaxID=300189 RepID=Q5GMY9_9GAMC|nr:putative nucleocapsid protein [Pigeon coronavirus]